MTPYIATASLRQCGVASVIPKRVVRIEAPHPLTDRDCPQDSQQCRNGQRHNPGHAEWRGEGNPTCQGAQDRGFRHHPRPRKIRSVVRLIPLKNIAHWLRNPWLFTPKRAPTKLPHLGFVTQLRSLNRMAMPPGHRPRR
jgi:hypothetical protein